MHTRRALGTIAFALALAVAATALAQSDAVTRIDVVAKPASHAGPCPVSVEFTATIFVTKYPLAIDYWWERSDGVIGPKQHVEIQAASQAVTDTWTTGHHGEHQVAWEKLHVLAPVRFSSPQGQAALACQ